MAMLNNNDGVFFLAMIKVDNALNEGALNSEVHYVK